MVPAERNVTVAIGHGKKAARHIDAWLRGRQWSPRPSTRLATSRSLNTWYYSDAPKTVRPLLDAARRQSTSTKSQGGLDEEQCPVRGAPLPVLRQLLRVRQLLRRLPGQRRHQAGPGQPLSSSTTTTARAAACAPECPCGAIKMVPRKSLLHGAFPPDWR
jgi:hypothetical protein